MSDIVDATVVVGALARNDSINYRDLLVVRGEQQRG